VTQQELIEHINRCVQENNELRQKNQYLETMVANLQKRIAQFNTTEDNGIQTVYKPDINTCKKHSFTHVLLTRIEELEEQLVLVQKISEKSKEIKQKLPETIPLQTPTNSIKPKSKTMPEIFVDIS
jgi:uncharacterized coiled-coil DUF342 family protein